MVVQTRMEARDLSLELRGRFTDLGCSSPLEVSVSYSWDEVTGEFAMNTELLGPSACVARRSEFIAGRRLANQGLAAIGFEEHLIARGPSREPVWPAAIRGSITHTLGLAAAVVWRPDESDVSIGIDAERRGRIEKTDIGNAFTAGEREMMVSLSPLDRDLFSTVVFSAKEALYKAQFPLTGQYIDYSEVSISPTASSGTGFGRLELVLEDPANVLKSFECRLFYQCTGDFVVTGALVRARQPKLK